MELPVNAKVMCTDGHCGRSTHVVLNPSTEEITHIVVKEEKPPHAELLVPAGGVTATTRDSITLRYSREELARLEPFVETEYIEVDIPQYAGGRYSLAPYRYQEPETVTMHRETIPPGEVAIRRGAEVEATDGHVGHVDEFVIEPKTKGITHLVLRKGHLWGERQIAIPIAAVERIEEDTVYLNMDKEAIEALPSTNTR
jgi:sporulation protein YlmC with PRC-barrel domain